MRNLITVAILLISAQVFSQPGRFRVGSDNSTDTTFIKNRAGFYNDVFMYGYKNLDTNFVLGFDPSTGRLVPRVKGTPVDLLNYPDRDEMNDSIDNSISATLTARDEAVAAKNTILGLRLVDSLSTKTDSLVYWINSVKYTIPVLVTGGVSTNLGNSNLTLSSNRTLSGNSKSFTISGVSDLNFDATGDITQTSAGNVTITGTASAGIVSPVVYVASDGSPGSYTTLGGSESTDITSTSNMNIDGGIGAIVQSAKNIFIGQVSNGKVSLTSDSIFITKPRRVSGNTDSSLVINSTTGLVEQRKITPASTTDNSLTVSSGVISLKKSIQTLTYGTTLTWNVANGLNSTVTLTGNVTTFTISNSQNGDYGLIKVAQDGTGNRTIVLPSGSKVIGGGTGAITLSTAANSIDILTYFYDGTNYFWNYGKNYN